MTLRRGSHPQRAAANHWVSWIVGSLAFASLPARAEVSKELCVQAYADAQSLRAEGSLLEARARLQQCAQIECPAALARDCTQWLAEVEQNVPSVVFAVTDQDGHDIAGAKVRAGARVVAERTDGQPVALNPGLYTFSIEAEGYAPERQELVIRQSEKSRMVRVPLTRLSPPLTADALDPDPVPRERGFVLPAPAIALGATALAGVAGFAYFGLTGMSKRDDAERCEMNCRGLIDDGKRDYVIADISLGVAVLAAGSAVLLTWLGQPEPPAPATSSGGRPGALPLRWSARF
jgi:hypothetical protein